MTEAQLPERYRPLRLLGRGGQAAVYLVTDRFHGNAWVALKALRGEAASAGEGALREEFLVLTRLAHPNLARVRDFGGLPGGRGAYFTSDYIRGGNLIEWALGLPVEERWPALLDVAVQALSALHYLSLRGVCHGDLKPANLLIEPPGTRGFPRPWLKMIDFGAARLPGAGGGRRAALGTLAYLPPPADGDSRARGAAGDLYSLGMALFHAGVGRLPFPLGEASAVRDWWSRGVPARPSESHPGVPESMDLLIAGLTSLSGPERLRTAAEALELLRRRVHLPPPVRPASGDEVWTSGRELFVEKLSRRIRQRQGGSRIFVVAGPRGSGKTRVLEALAARLQVAACRSVVFSHSGDTLPLSELEAVVTARESLRPGQRLEVPELVSHLRSLAVAVILDDETGSPPTSSTTLPLLRELARSLSHAGSPPAASCLVVATTEPEAVPGLLDVGREDLEIHTLEALSRDSLAEMAREFFSVEVVPDRLIDVLERESAGLPAGVLESLERLSSCGVVADSFGHLKLPEALPVPGTPARKDPAADLSPKEARVLGLLALAGEPLDPADLSARFPEATPEGWHYALEGLRARGFLRGDDAESLRYRLAGRSLTIDAVSLLDPEEARRARESLRDFFQRHAGSLPAERGDTLLACVRNLVALGDASAAVLPALRAARRLARARRFEEALAGLQSVVSALGDLPPGTPAARELRRCLQPRLRAAGILLRLGRPREVGALLAVPPEREPVWFGRAARRLRVEAFEALGRTTDAIEELEPLLVRAPAVSTRSACLEDVACLEAAARLAPLYFRAGREKDGLRCLELGRGLLEHDPAGWEGNAPKYGEVLAYFARAESAHGLKEHARSLLEKSSAVTRHLGRDDLAWKTLNELGILHAESQRFDEALAVLEESEERALRSGDRLGALKSIFNRAVIRYRSQELDEAEDLFSRARTISEAVGPHGLSAAIWNGHAGVLQEKGRLVDALRLYRRVLRLGDSRSLPEKTLAHNNLAELYLRLGRLRRAALHASQGFRMARRIRDTFRDRLTLRVRGLVRWALGDTRRARADLETARGQARKEGDLRAEGVALHYLGLLAARRGEGQEAWRLLRGGMAASRRARDWKHFQAGRVAVLCELVRRDRKTAARRILSVDRRSGGEASGETSPARWLGALADASWPENAGDLLSLLRQAETRGLLWDVFQALCVLCEDPLLPAGLREECMLRRETLAARLLRRLGPRRASRFREAWRLPRGPSPGPALDRERTEESVRTEVPQPRTARLDWGDLEGVVDGLLEEIRKGLGWQAAWLIEDPESPLPGGLGRNVDPLRLRAVLGEHGAALERARRSSRPVYAPPYILVRLPNPQTRPVLCLEAGPGAWPAGTSGLDALWSRVERLALLVRVAELERSLSSEHERHAESREEVHRLNALLVRDHKELETALTTRSLELLDLRRRDLGSGVRPLASRRRPVGVSPAMRELLSRIPRIARRDLPVLLLGESGVGKDLLARSIHDLGPRQDRPFLAEICNITRSLMESELFGFVRGAFTGAVVDRPGIFERAAGGSIYLDEITDLSHDLQVRLLRVLEEKAVRPVGGEESRPVDFRLLSSSRASLEELQAETSIRRDLLYRINTEVLWIPPLRERREDIPVLVDAILKEYCQETGFPAPYLHRNALELLQDHEWPGNVRELENTIQRALVSRSPEITRDMLSIEEGTDAPPAGGGGDEVQDFREARRRLERDLILRALQAHGGNATRAAEALNITRRYLGTLLGRHGIRLEKSPKQRKRGEKGNPQEP